MAEGTFSTEWARGVINDGCEKAKGFVEDPEQMQGLLNSLQEKLANLPDTVGTAFANVPLMASMVKSYITREYTDVSPKVVISLVSAFIYLVKQKDIVPDTVPVVGLLDDLAVITVVMAINEPELKAYAAWREAQQAGVAEAEVAEAEMVEVADEPEAEVLQDEVLSME